MEGRERASIIYWSKECKLIVDEEETVTGGDAAHTYTTRKISCQIMGFNGLRARLNGEMAETHWRK
jgi:hypothetical protein